MHPSWVTETAITRLCIKHLFYDTIEQICRHIKGYRNTKENLHHDGVKKKSAMLPFATIFNYIISKKNINLNNIYNNIGTILYTV